MGVRRAPPPRLEARCAEEQRVETLDGPVSNGALGAQVAQPRT
jgi:hypothetical protein